MPIIRIELPIFLFSSKKAEKAAFSVDTEAQTDEFLAKFILSKNARKYAIAREISKADRFEIVNFRFFEIVRNRKFSV